MKKIVMLLVILTLASTMVFAAGAQEETERVCIRIRLYLAST